MYENTIDMSIKVIRNNVPKFIRKVFEIFISSHTKFSELVLNEDSYKINKFFEDKVGSIDSTDSIKFSKLAEDDTAIYAHDFIEYTPNIGSPEFPYLESMKDLYKDLAIETQYSLMSIYINTDHGEFDPWKNRKEGFEFTAEGSTQFPIEQICPFISEYYPSDLPFIRIFPKTYLSTGNSHIGRFGGPTVFENMDTYMYIDVSHILDNFYNLFFKMAFTHIEINTGLENRIKTIFSSIPLLFQDEKYNSIITSMVNEYIDKVTKSAVLTYMIFSGRSLNSKSTLSEWFFSSFMKETINILNNTLENETPDRSAPTNYRSFDNTFKFAFSNWCSIYDTLLKSNVTDKHNDYIDFGRLLLENLISLKFSTPNAFYQFGKNGMQESKVYIEMVSKYIDSSDNKMYLKNCNNYQNLLRNNKANDNYCEVMDNAFHAKYLKTTHIVATLFVHASYLIVLDSAIYRVSQSVNEKEFYSGHTTHDIMHKKFTDILTLINGILCKYSKTNSYSYEYIVASSSYKADIIRDAIKYLYNNTNDTTVFISTANKQIKYYSSIKNHSIRDENTSKVCEVIFHTLYELPPYTFIERIQNSFNNLNLSDRMSQMYNDPNQLNESPSMITSKSIFGKILSNQFNENFNKNSHKTIELNPYGNNINTLRTVESLEQDLEMFKIEISNESEWAYGNYNTLASMNKGVIEITNDLHSSSDSKDVISTDVDRMVVTQASDIKNNDDDENGDKKDETVITSGENYTQRIMQLSNEINKIILNKFK